MFSKLFQAINRLRKPKKFILEPRRKMNVAYYLTGLGISMIGVTFASVPLYQIFCQKVGMGVVSEYARVKNLEDIRKMEPIRERKITVEFDCIVDNVPWKFEPVTKTVAVVPGETALAFFKAKNLSTEPVIGISTYNIIPYEAAPYFHKIQCFCFEEQILNAGEEVDMPVFFFIDPDFDKDLKMLPVTRILLHYTFMKAKDALNMPLPGFLKVT